MERNHHKETAIEVRNCSGMLIWGLKKETILVIFPKIVITGSLLMAISLGGYILGPIMLPKDQLKEVIEKVISNYYLQGN